VTSEIAVIGTSWGGLAALHQIFAALPSSFTLPIVVIQHRHKDSGQFLPRVLQEDTRLCVCEVEDKAPIVGGNIYIGSWLETGSAWDKWHEKDWRNNVTVGAILESLLGPIFLGGSFNSGHARFYVVVGPLFR